MQEKTNILKCHPIKNVNIVKTDDTYLYCDDGSKIVDFEAGIWCTALGHSNPRINKVITEQISKAMHLNTRYISGQAKTLAEKLLKLNNLANGKAVFLSSGSEAVEFAITIINLITEKSKLLTFSKSYLSAYNLRSDLWEKIDFSICKHCKKDQCFSACPAIQDIDFSQIAGFVLEPGSSGDRFIFPPAQLVEYIAKKVKSNDGYIVVNEVTTGFGKTGKLFGYQHYTIQPDIIAMGKALGNGYPVSGVVMSEKAANIVENMDFKYAQSHQNDPLGCAIANEVISIFAEDELIERARKKGELLFDSLSEITNQMIKTVRGRGLMCAIELNESGLTELIFDKMFDKGFAIGTTPKADVLRFSPASTIREEVIKRMCQALQETLNEVSTT